MVEDPAACLASVSRVETLGFPRWHLLDEQRRIRLESLIDALVELPLDQRVAACAIELRRQKKMSLADSIIAGTALVYQVPLITRNETDFIHIAGLVIINPFLRPSNP
jgi:predicted nucleic acid-binding protein